MRYTVVSPLMHNGERFEPGEVLEADEIAPKHAQALIEIGVLEGIDADEASGAAGGKDSKKSTVDKTTNEKSPEGAPQAPSGAIPDAPGPVAEEDPGLATCAELDAQDPDRADESLWTKDGRPDARVLSEKLDRTVHAAERDELWNRYLESRSAE